MFSFSLRNLALAVVPFVLLTATPSKATVTPFNVQFGSDGSGSFVYDDDNGGANAGFTTFKLDFSPILGTNYANILLSSDGQTLVGPGGSDATILFQILTDPSSSNFLALDENKFVAPSYLIFLVVGNSFPFGVSPISAICVANANPGQYGVCNRSITGVITGSGNFTTSLLSSVPEPSPLSLLAVGLAGLGVARRRRTKKAAA